MRGVKRIHLPKNDQMKNVGQLRRGKSKFSVNVLVRPLGAEWQKITMCCTIDYCDDSIRPTIQFE